MSDTATAKPVVYLRLGEKVFKDGDRGKVAESNSLCQADGDMCCVITIVWGKGEITIVDSKYIRPSIAGYWLPDKELTKGMCCGREIIQMVYPGEPVRCYKCHATLRRFYDEWSTANPCD